MKIRHACWSFPNGKTMNFRSYIRENQSNDHHLFASLNLTVNQHITHPTANHLVV
jgi:hypothetical protein